MPNTPELITHLYYNRNFILFIFKGRNSFLSVYMSMNEFNTKLIFKPLTLLNSLSFANFADNLT